MRTFRLFSMAAVVLVMAACSSEDSALENATPATTGTMKFTATLAAPGGGATTRTTYTEVTEGVDAGTINVAWEKGDQIALVNMVTQNVSIISVGTIAADGSASISGDIPAGENGNQIVAYYPTSIVLATTEEEDFRYTRLQQAGTLKYIQDNLDFRIGLGTLSVSGDKATLSDKLQMESGIAIWKLTLQNSSSEALSATKVTIKKGGEVLAATADISATSTVYLAVVINDDDGLSNADIIIEATVGSDTYTYSASGVTLERGKYYQSTVKMKALAYPVALSTVTAGYIGSVVCSDGNVYRAKTAVPTGCTAVGILGKVTTTGHGLIIALKDADQRDWESINGWDDANYAGTTLKVLPDDDARGTNLTSYTKLGSTDVSNWAVGQKSDYEAIFTNLGSNYDNDGKTFDNNVNAYITTGVGGDAMSGTYWSATEQDNENAWFFESYSWGNKAIWDNLSVRPVLGF